MGSGDAPSGFGIDPESIEWFRYPRVAAHLRGRPWLESQVLLGLAPHTVEAYGRGAEDFLAFCDRAGVDAVAASRETILQYVGDLRGRPAKRGRRGADVSSASGLANATMQQRLTAVRLFYDFLIEENVRDTNPVGRGRFTPGKAAFRSRADRGMLPRQHALPWIPTDQQWRELLLVARSEPIRNRCMLAFAYDAGLRREELCSLASDDLDPAHRTLRVRAETTKGKRQRTVPYSASAGELLRQYLSHRRSMSRERGPLFLSESRRNYGSPITLWTWSKVVQGMADRAGLPRFSTHTLRHLCLTDLARAGWEIHEIATFAGHRNTTTTQQYIHLSGRDLAQRMERGMDQIHAWRMRLLAAEFGRDEIES